MNSPNSMLPPALPSADAIEATFGLIALIADPTAAQKRLTEIDRAAKAYRAATDEHASVAGKAAEVAKAQDALVVREKAAATLEADLANRQTALAVAANALAERERKLSDAEKALAQHEREHAARVKANEEKIAAVRASLA